jgi:hypothetical protein
MKRDDIICGAIIFLFGGVTVALSLMMPIGTFRSAGTGLFPLCLGILLMVLSVLFALNLLFGKKIASTKTEAPAAMPTSTGQVILFLGATALSVLCFNTLGYAVTSFLLMVLLLRILGTERWVFNIVLSLVTAAGSYSLRSMA